MNPKSKDIYLPALTDFYYLTDPVSGTETTYPIFREQYFLCEEYVDDYVIFFDQIKYTSNSLSYIFDGYELKDIEFGDSNDNSDEVSEAE